MKKTLYTFVILLLSTPGIRTFGQADTEFWFVAPEITIGHGNFPGGEPVYFRVSAMALEATVRIYQPANPSGMDTTIIVPAQSTISLDASPWINDLENRPGGIVLNKGVHIRSDNLITVYYDVDEYWNQDIFSLKGKNALGFEFYTPMQNVWNNGNYNPIPYSGIDIVATEDNTMITITPTTDLVGGYIAGIPFTISLNRGETFSCTAISQAAADHPAGTHIVADKPIALTLKDDSVKGSTCNDLIGDQTVPMVNSEGNRIVGYEYIVMRGKINLIDPNANIPDPDGVPTGERIFIMATEPNTQVFIDGVLLTTLASPGEQIDYQISNNSTHVEGDKPIMVFHTSGFGCEMGGAVLPTTDGCTGSVEVSFTRSTDRDFYLNIMTIDAAKSGFTIHYADGSTFPIPDSWFEPVGLTDYVCLKKNNKYFANTSGGGVPQGEVVRITNSVSVFHLGIIEGGRSTGSKYGYFSEYSAARGEVLLVETGSRSQFICAGDSIQFRASGGISYSWSPTNYLDDPSSPTPVAKPPPGIYSYDVTIQRGCFADTTISVVVGVADEVEARFEADYWDICSQDTVTFENLSIGVDKSSVSKVQWDFDLEDLNNLPLNDTSSTVQHVYTNTSASVVQKTIQLLVWNEQGCISSVMETVSIYPNITAEFVTDVTEGCGPLEVAFTNLSSSGSQSFMWEFGDGNSDHVNDPIHIYDNPTMLSLVFEAKLVALSQGNCRDTFTLPITVHPNIEASFDSDSAICHLQDILIRDGSIGADSYAWDFGDGSPISTSPGPELDHYYINVTSSPVNYTIELKVENEEGCSHQVQKDVMVYPESAGGILKGNEGPIIFGSSTGPISLSDYTGEVLKWQKIVKAGPWVDIAHTDTLFSEIPASADLWQYRAVIQSGSCTETMSDLYNVFVLPKEILVIPDEGQSKQFGDADPIFTYTNSEWNDNSQFSGTLGRMTGETSGDYPYELGNLAAGVNYTLSLDSVPKFSIHEATGFVQREGTGDLELTIHSTPQYSSHIIRYRLPHDGELSISLTNMSGQVSDILINKMRGFQGEHSLLMEGMNLDPGIYLLSLEFKGQEMYMVRTVKLIVGW